ncbi:MAG: hypothetical protein JNL07_08835, partial [Rhodospirillales bacterium]|nr:hypothetical protein [Rhodospirillales bacterium]
MSSFIKLRAIFTVGAAVAAVTLTGAAANAATFHLGDLRGARADGSREVVLAAVGDAERARAEAQRRQVDQQRQMAVQQQQRANAERQQAVQQRQMA